MKCSDFLSGLSAYIDGEASRRAQKQAKAHLAECADCRKAYTEMEALIKTVRTLDVPVPEHLAEEVLSAVRQSAAPEKTAFRLPWFLTSWPLYSAVAACLLLFTVFAVGNRRPMQNDALVYTAAPAAETPVDTTETEFSAAKNSRNMPGAKAIPAVEAEPYLYVTDAMSYAPVSSLVRYGITFIATDPEAQPVFESAKQNGEAAVLGALSAAGFRVTREETILEDCTAPYNALCAEATALAARIAEGDETAASALVQTEADMEAMREKCETAELTFALKE